jgi:hypothetical protein
MNPSYQIKRCMIGKFRVSIGFPIQRLEWNRGYLGQFDLHQEKTKAFVGDVWFRRLKLPKNPTYHDVQWLRDTREALNARSNSVAAGVFHASELALSRRRESCINQLASWVYQVGSNFGNSIGLPIFWLIAIFGSIFWLALEVGTVVNKEEKSGWQQALEGGHEKAQVLRALVYAGQSIFNPFNVIVQKPLVAISNPNGALWGLLLGVLGIVAFAFLLLSLRRRFKLE